MNSDVTKEISGGKMVNAFNPSTLSTLDPETQLLIKRRIRLLGPAYRLFYQTPVEISHGSGVFLYDKDHNEYLDAYNNVAVVGHCHPKVVTAVHEQMQNLCTHTRYIQSGILDYSEKLLEKFDGDISLSGHLMFTCTGSEANDLALRIAQHHTGKNGIIITSEAYHGNSHLTASLSPSLGENSHLGKWVRQIPSPDSYRVPQENMARWFADQVSLQIKDLERHGNGLCALIVDSAFSSDGIYTHPNNILSKAIDVVHQAGGLFIADEVQSGFGRLGDSFWGYQRHGVNPDIVTMGKPMGNGFPVAAIAVTHQAVESFGCDMRYFNTFGGNSVAIAAAHATLNVIDEEKLIQNANVVGKIIIDRLKELAMRYDFIGDVRGSGLYIGVELVTDKNTKAPDAVTTSNIVNGLRDQRILISATGPYANVLKIRPPLIFNANHADRLLTQFDVVLSRLKKNS